MGDVPARLLLALAVALALADASIVTLGLPAVLDELDATVEGTAGVLGAYTLALALGLPAAELARRRAGARRVGAVGLLLFAAASLACGAAGSLAVLVAARAVQALGAAGGLVAAFALLDAGRPGTGRRAWRAAAVLGIAAGPALGGALTEAFDWRAIFLAQAPVGALAAVACLRAPEPPGDAGTEAPGAAAPAGAPPRGAALAALALVAAALTGVLFLLVLLLVAGWSLSPLAAAAVVSVLPVSAALAARVPGPPRTRAACGCVLVGAGVLALAFLPGDEIVLTLVPQVLAGVGLGLALPALEGGLLPERTSAQAAGLLSARHLGITAALALLAPIASAQLDRAVEETRERGAALVLDARLPPLQKLALATELGDDLDPVDARGALERRLAASASRFPAPADRAAYARLRRRADEVLLAGVNDAFRVAFLVTGTLALLAALALVVVRPALGRRARLALALALVALAVPAAQALALPALRPEPVELADPCAARELPERAGLEGTIERAALVALDRAACRYGSSREELVLALADPEAAEDYEREHGVDPARIADLLGALLG